MKGRERPYILLQDKPIGRRLWYMKDGIDQKRNPWSWLQVKCITWKYDTVASIAAGLIVMNLIRAVCMKSMLLKLGDLEPSQHFLRSEVTEKTCVGVAGHRNFRNQTDFPR